MRCVLVKVPSTSATCVDGKKNTSVLMSCGLDLAVLDLRRILPESGRLGEPVVLHHQPLELPERRALELGVERRGRVLPDAEHALHRAGVHRHEHRHVRMVAENLRVPVVAEVVLLGRRVAVHRLEIGDHELRRVGPVAGRQRLGREIVLQRVVLLERRRRRM